MSRLEVGHSGELDRYGSVRYAGCVDPSGIGMRAYERVAASIQQDIRAGRLKPGDKLPGNRALAEQYNVALGTAQNALRYLQDEGWLVATPSVGVFVAEAPPLDNGAVMSTADIRRALADLRATVAALEERMERMESHQSDQAT